MEIVASIKESHARMVRKQVYRDRITIRPKTMIMMTHLIIINLRSQIWYPLKTISTASNKNDCFPTYGESNSEKPGPLTQTYPKKPYNLTQN